MNQYEFKIISGRTAYSSKLIAAILLLSINLIPTAPVFADFGQGAPTIPNAQPFGIDKQTAKVDSSTGAFTQHIALDIPPGRNGFNRISRSTTIRSARKTSIVGYGWQLSIPYIQRLNKTGLAKSLQQHTLLHFFARRRTHEYLGHGHVFLGHVKPRHSRFRSPFHLQSHQHHLRQPLVHGAGRLEQGVHGAGGAEQFERAVGHIERLCSYHLPCQRHLRSHVLLRRLLWWLRPPARSRSPSPSPPKPLCDLHPAERRAN